MEPNTPIEKITRLSPFQKKALSGMGIKTIWDVLKHFPTRYGEKNAVKSIEFLTAGESAVIFGRISNLKVGKTFKSRVPISTAQIEDTTGKIKLMWFSQPYIAKMFEEGSIVRVEGQVSERKIGSDNQSSELSLLNPKIEKVNKIPDGTSESLFGETDDHNLFPTYKETKGISSNWIYHCLQKIFRSGILENLKDPIPSYILKKYSLPTLSTALVWIHAPRTEKDADIARKRFAFEEIFFVQLDRQKERQLTMREKTFVIKKTKKEMDEFIGTFPFPITKAQKQSVDTILKDFESGHPMSRLLEGDVGSGKTAVAASACFSVVTTPPPNREYGALQVAYMAPTEILAEQHFESFIEYFKKYKIEVGLVTGSGAKKFPSKTPGETWTKISKPQLLKWVESGQIPILIGTHSLIQKTVKFKNLAFIIIDEQHRFGVKQRKELRRKQDIAPHLLSMTATPIPRTLALTIFGDLDLSLLDELPPGRKPVETKIILPQNRQDVYESMREEIKSGRQAYVICPRIDEPDKEKELAVNARSVTEETKRLQEKVFKEFKVMSITGKMSPKEKEDAMRKFKNKEAHILVATSVVEVGVNVPNATMIVIENAERFGLAQLHQLRGRVLRSSHRPYCFIFTESKSAKTIQRLKSFMKAKNGFELAEADLKQRGAGDLGGQKQWGVSDIAMEALRNIKMVEAAREEAKNIIEKDIELDSFPLLKARLNKANTIHME